MTLSSNEFDLDNTLSFYPNPTSTFISINKPEGMIVDEINIYDTLGQLLFTTSWDTHYRYVEISHQDFLFINFQTDNGLIIKSVIKQ